MEWLFVLLCHVTFWVMFTVTDVIEETQNEDYFLPITVMAMVMTAAAYVTWDWKRHGSQHRKFMPMLLYVLKWLASALDCRLSGLPEQRIIGLYRRQWVGNISSMALNISFMVLCMSAYCRCSYLFGTSVNLPSARSNPLGIRHKKNGASEPCSVSFCGHQFKCRAFHGHKLPCPRATIASCR